MQDDNNNAGVDGQIEYIQTEQPLNLNTSFQKRTNSKNHTNLNFHDNISINNNDNQQSCNDNSIKNFPQGNFLSSDHLITLKENQFNNDAVNTFLDNMNNKNDIKNLHNSFFSDTTLEKPEKKDFNCWTRTGRIVRKVLASKTFTAVFIFVTIVNLFLHDIAYLTLDHHYDYIIDIILLLSFLFFLVEFLFAVVFEPEYRFTLFFFADLFAILGLIPNTYLLVGHPEDDFTLEDSKKYFFSFLFYNILTAI